MSPPLKLFLQRWLINAVAVLVAANVIPGIHYEGVATLLVAALVLGVLNALLRPLLFLLSLPLVILSLGLFSLIINAFLLLIVGQLVKHFYVTGFWAAFWGGVIISLVSILLNSATGTGEHRFQIHRKAHRRSPPRDPKPPAGQGPVIDV